MLGIRFDVFQEDDVAQWLMFQPTHDLDQILGRAGHRFSHLGSILVNRSEKYGVRKFAFSASVA